MSTLHRALNRFGLGPTRRDHHVRSDPRGWLRGQLHTRDAPLDTSAHLSDPDEVAHLYRSLREAREENDMDRFKKAREGIVQVAISETRTALTQRITGNRPFVERLVAFWSNHLCVSVEGKLIVAGLAGGYEREAIRPHVLGRFEDMLLASARHPAMLLYLDNAQSVGPNSAASKRRARRGRQPGLNENYARELLELHTLGVDGGYTQEDVLALARILTGWGLDRNRTGSGPAFRFRTLLHEPGAKTVLGARYGPDGVAEGEAVIRDLARHPSTARFLARKLAVHFVADEPPHHAVQHIERAFRNTEGDLREVADALIDLDAAWDPAHRKFKTPQDWLVSIGRTIGMEDAPMPFVAVLRQLRHPLWSPASPKGYGDLMREWADPDALMNRAELARSIARHVARSRVEPLALAERLHLDAADPRMAILEDETLSRQDRFAITFASPAFQWR